MPKNRSVRIKWFILIVVLAMAAAVGGLWLQGNKPDSHEPNIILVILDTTRADALTCYGNVRKITPAIDRIAEEGVLFDQAISSSSWTLPAIASILTGVNPSIHGAFGKNLILIRCREDVPHGTTHLRNAGFRTKAFVNAPFLHPDLGLNVGFEDYDFYVSTNQEVRRADKTIDLALAYFKNHSQEKNFTLIHLFDPHLDYDPPHPWLTKFTHQSSVPPSSLSMHHIQSMIASGNTRPTESDLRYIQSVYHAEVAFVDAQIKRLIDGLKKMKMWDRTTLIITADHGEEFWDHNGFEHGHTMYDELIRIPLIVRLPKHMTVVRHRVKTQVRALDLMPTIFELAGLKPLAEFDGESLLNLMLTSAETKNRPILSEGTLYGVDKLSWRVGSHKYIHDLGGQGDELYHVSLDPGETHNLIEQKPDLARQLRTQLLDFRSRLEQRTSSLMETQEVNMKSHLLDAIRSTGYIR